MKATVIKNSESLLTRIVNENCENSFADLDGSKPMLLNISGILQITFYGLSYVLIENW